MSSAEAPATTGEATDVPLNVRHPPLGLDPRSNLENVLTSGLTRPYPSGNSHLYTHTVRNLKVDNKCAKMNARCHATRRVRCNNIFVLIERLPARRFVIDNSSQTSNTYHICLIGRIVESAVARAIVAHRRNK
jgi:hypothetical protein